MWRNALCSHILFGALIVRCFGAESVWDPVEGFTDGSDLYHFVTRPELKPPRLQVLKHRPEAITPGYWFLAPYTSLAQPEDPHQYEHIPCQTGPAIYDGDGELVWSGACHVRNGVTGIFRPTFVNDTWYLSMTHAWFNKNPLEILDDHYATVFAGNNPAAHSDVHEFTLSPDGNTAINTWGYQQVGQSGIYARSGFSQFSLWNESRVLFNWDALDNGITLGEGQLAPEHQPTRDKSWWDWFHINSVDENEAHDFLVSARFMNAVYKISGVDGHIIWRLGGPKSDFTVGEGAEFHWAHDARFHGENETHTIISLFDNGNIDTYNFSKPLPNMYVYKPPPSVYQGESSVKLIALNTATTPMTATLIRHIPRPDGNRTPMAGNSLFLSDPPESSAVITNWVRPGYLTEHDSSDRLVFEAKLMSERFVFYRAYKSHFVGRPTDSPVLKTILMDTPGGVASTMYVSWNGATEVRSWSFHGADRADGPFTLLASVQKRGFETSFVYPGQVKHSYVEGLDADGTSLGRSGKVESAPMAAESEYRIHSASPSLTDAAELSPQQTAKPESASVPLVWKLVLVPFAVFGMFNTARHLSQTASIKRLILWPRHRYSLIKEDTV